MSLGFADVVAHTSFSVNAHRVTEDTVILGITLEPDEHWHTYWSNPGDAGLSLSIRLADESLTVTDLEFPIPHRYELGGIVAYGYEKAETFLFSVTGNLPTSLEGKASWLTCDDTSCLPGKKEFSLSIVESSDSEPEWLERAKSSQPTKLEISNEKSASKEGAWTFSFQAEVDLSGWHVYPKLEGFSEEEGGTSLVKVDQNYTFKFTYNGSENPESPQFLLTNGKKGYLVSY